MSDALSEIFADLLSREHAAASAPDQAVRLWLNALIEELAVYYPEEWKRYCDGIDPKPDDDMTETFLGCVGSSPTGATSSKGEVMAKGPTMKALEERLDLVLREIDKLRAKEDLLRDMIREAKGEPKVKFRAPRSNVKQTILDLLEAAGEAGLNATSAVETAARAGTTLERGTVSSLLSRLKHEGVVIYDGSVYRLADRGI